MDLKLRDKVALVTGSSRGLGLAIASALAEEGCRVTLCARGVDDLERAKAAVGRAAGSPSRVLSQVADMTAADDVARVVDATATTFGSLDILVNNIGLARGAGIVETPDKEWQAAFDATLMPAVRASRLAVPVMRRSGGGVVLMVASIWGRESGGRMTYNAIKAAEISLAKSMAQQLAKDNIRVVSLAPGSILFEGGSWHRRQLEDPEGIAQFVRQELPFGRFGRAEEVGAVAAFLCSPRASWVSGACITVDGGQSRSNI
ncbi:MAG: SDR family oxidoreductase [Vicinamibacterales bacterium]